MVAATDYPGITLHDELTKLELKPTPKTDQVGDTKLLIGELTTLQDERLAFLRGHINMSLLGITGHSAGGFATGDLSADFGQVLIPMAGHGTKKPKIFSKRKFSTLIIGGENDTIVPGDQTPGYESSPTPKRHLGVANSGHNTYSDLCWLSPPQGGLSGVGRSCGVAGAKLLEKLADQGCQFAEHDPHAAAMLAPEEAWPIVRYATTAVFEETLLCDDRMAAQLAALPQRFNSSVMETWAEDLHSFTE